MPRKRNKIYEMKKEFEALCKMQATQKEIMSFFEIDMTALDRFCKRNYQRTFSKTKDMLSDGGRMSLRRKQMSVALDGSVPMLIWLGKQYLGQTDSPIIFSEESAYPIVPNDDISDS